MDLAIRDDHVHALVPRVRRHSINHAIRVTQTHTNRIRSGVGEKPVVVPATSAEPTALGVEEKSGNDEEVDRAGLHRRARGIRLEETAAPPVKRIARSGRVENDLVSGEPRKRHAHAPFIEPTVQRLDSNLPRKRGVERDGAGLRPLPERLDAVCCARIGVLARGDGQRSGEATECLLGTRPDRQAPASRSEDSSADSTSRIRPWTRSGETTP